MTAVNQDAEKLPCCSPPRTAQVRSATPMNATCSQRPDRVRVAVIEP